MHLHMQNVPQNENELNLRLFDYVLVHASSIESNQFTDVSRMLNQHGNIRLDCSHVSLLHSFWHALYSITIIQHWSCYNNWWEFTTIHLGMHNPLTHCILYLCFLHTENLSIQLCIFIAQLYMWLWCSSLVSENMQFFLINISGCNFKTNFKSDNVNVNCVQNNQVTMSTLCIIMIPVSCQPVHEICNFLKPVCFVLQ